MKSIPQKKQKCFSRVPQVPRLGPGKANNSEFPIGTVAPTAGVGWNRHPSILVSCGIDVLEGGIEMAVFCQRCGTGLPPAARFCSNCGAVVPVVQSASGRPLGGPLLRPRVGRQIAGVCLALAQSNGWDVAVVRIVTVLGFCFTGGIVGVAYVAGWIGIPEEPLALPGAYPPGI
jgi:phage shock protein C